MGSLTILGRNNIFELWILTRFISLLVTRYICDKGIIQNGEKRIPRTNEAVISLSRQITPIPSFNILCSGGVEISREIEGLGDLLLMPRYPPIDLTHSIFSLSAYNNLPLLGK